MRTVLTLKLLGNPAIYLNQKEVFFSFAKINALLYYLSINKTVSREEIAGILWENKDTQTAKKNLRNTIYQANKVLGADYIIAPNRTVLSLNPELEIESDLDTFSGQPLEHLSLYQGDFLQGFYLRDGEAFDLWVAKLRAHYEQVYIKACYQKIEQQMGREDFAEIEASLHRLISLDEFEEKNYQLLMKLYRENNRPGKVIETYYKLVNILDRELGISPNEAIQQLYHEVVAKDRNERKTKQFLRNTDHFFGRVEEIRRLERYFSKILEEQEARVLTLVGGTGLGKRTVTRQVLANQTKYFQIVMSECFRDEADSPLQAWRGILDGLGDLVIQHQILSISQWQTILQYYFPVLPQELNQRQGEILETGNLAQFIVDILQKISKKKALVLLIEDCHWMDQESLLLLKKVLNHLADYPIALVLTKHLNTTAGLEHLLNHLQARDLLEFIHLQPLSEEESRLYIQQELGDETLSQRELAEIYRVSQGNPFFLSEYARVLKEQGKFSPLTPAIEARLALRFEALNSREEELLNYLACFRGAAPLAILAQIMVLPFDEMVDLVEGLCHKQLLQEDYQKEELVTSFAQRVLQIYCYESLSLAKRRILHNQIAQEMEVMLEELPYNANLLNEIAYHYRESKQLLKALDYSLDYLNSTLQFHHELFPIYSKKFGFIEKTDADNHSLVKAQLNRIEKTIGDLEGQYESHKDFQILNLRFLYLKGRFAIRSGQYQEGLGQIRRVIALARELHSMDYVLEGYRQLIHYCIQSENIPEMRYYTDLALDAAVQDNNHEAIGINLRLKGLYHLMIGDIKEAARLIRESIACFSLTQSLKSKYSIQIAAALDYLAEIEQITGRFDQAIAYQKEAIELTENKTAEPSLLVFYIGLGLSYYFTNQMEKAEQIFRKAKEDLQTLRFPWKEAQLEVYLALIDSSKGNYQTVLDFLLKRESLIERYSNPRDKGMIYYLMAVLKYRLLRGSISYQGFEELLDQPFERYYEIAKGHLNPYRDSQALTELEQLRVELNLAKLD
ncbi:AAA family ATPase [Streptococcus oricebi]|uniref:LuxR family transcriptional regulator n=1 Tax=Streptococcus oricebi TaxID=1547447 RepID=A0ABS5B538_9STRE|nr:tetratricopeptide repeat protein [Streptococcus oricebi]MBP2623968.1 LuxR family transcriptional regulator [Streptococcus oricebi]